jgi:hypothetical protein
LSLDEIDLLAPLGRVVHRRDNKIDVAGIEQRDARGGDDRDELQRDAERLRHLGGEIWLKPDDRARRVAETEGLIIGLGADDQRPTGADVVERARPGSPAPKDGENDAEEKRRHAGPPRQIKPVNTRCSGHLYRQSAGD